MDNATRPSFALRRPPLLGAIGAANTGGQAAQGAEGAGQPVADRRQTIVGIILFALGDMNCDGLINGFDIGPFVLALTNPEGYGATYPNCDINNADINEDGTINGFDIDPFVNLLTGG